MFQSMSVRTARSWAGALRAVTSAVRRRIGTSVPAAACRDRKSTRLNSSHSQISYAVFCLKKKNQLSVAEDAADFELNAAQSNREVSHPPPSGPFVRNFHQYKHSSCTLHVARS